MSASGLTAEFFDIKKPEELVGERATIHFQNNEKGTSTTLIELQYIFGGESLPAYLSMGGGEKSSQIIGSGRCPCKTK